MSLDVALAGSERFCGSACHRHMAIGTSDARNPHAVADVACAACRFSLTFVPQSGEVEGQYRRIRLVDREGCFDISHPQWFGRRKDDQTKRATSRWFLSESGKQVGVKIGDVSDEESIGSSTTARSLPVELTHKQRNAADIGRIIVGVFKGSRVEFEQSYALVSKPRTTRQRVLLPVETRRGSRTVCVHLLSNEEEFLGGACRGIRFE